MKPKAFQKDDKCERKCRKNGLFEKEQTWCDRCYGDWTFSDERKERLTKALGWKTPVKLVDCYYGDCKLSIQNGYSIHCIDDKCGGDPDLVLSSKTYEDPDDKFDAAKHAPLRIWQCGGRKCRQETEYGNTGIWCTSCHGLFTHSTSFLQLLEHRFKNEGYTSDSVVHGIDLTTDRE